MAPRRTRRGEGGQAVVEFAIVVPLLLLLVVGIFKFGTAYNNYIQLTNAVDAGARKFAVERGQASPCTDASAQVQTSAGSLTVSQVTITIPGSPAWTPSGSNPCPALTSGAQATLSAQYSCDLVIMGINFAPGCTLKASATESVE
jgi:Flp pilus assembly protein TadG